MNSEFIDINLLPQTARPTLGGAVWIRRMIPGLILLCFAAILLLASANMKRRNDRQLTQQRIEMQTMQQSIRDFSVVQTQVELLQQRVRTLSSYAEQLEQDAIRVERENPSVANFLRIVTDSLLPRMTLTGFVVEGPNRFVIRGEAGSPTLVLSYIERLKARSEIRVVTTRSVEQVKESLIPTTVRWTIEIEL